MIKTEWLLIFSCSLLATGCGCQHHEGGGLSGGAAYDAEAQYAASSPRVAVGGVMVRLPIVLYVQQVHTDEAGYFSYVKQLFGSLLNNGCGDKVQVVLWPEATLEGLPKAFLLAKSADQLLLTIPYGRPQTEASGFQKGLRFCSQIAVKERAQIIIVARGSVFGRGSYYTPQEIEARKDALKTASKTATVHVIVFGASVREISENVNGQALSVGRGGLWLD